MPHRCFPGASKKIRFNPRPALGRAPTSGQVSIERDLPRHPRHHSPSTATVLDFASECN